MSRGMSTRLVPIGPKAWIIKEAGGCLGELREIKSLFVIIPARGSPLDDVKGGYGSQAAAIEAIVRCRGLNCTVPGRG